MKFTKHVQGTSVVYGAKGFFKVSWGKAPCHVRVARDDNGLWTVDYTTMGPWESANLGSFTSVAAAQKAAKAKFS